MSTRSQIHGVSIVGTGSRTVVFGNGFGTGKEIWRHQVEALRGACRLVLFDYVGTPDTDLSAYSPERYDSLYAHADDVVELLEELDVRDTVFVGHSVSAMIGALVAVAAPERVSRLVMIAGSPCYIDEPGYEGGFTREEIDTVLTMTATEYHSWVSGFSPKFVGNPSAPSVIDEFASYLRRMRPDVAHAMLTAIFTSDLRAVLPRVRQPTMLIQPSHDIAVPPGVARYLAERLPDATLREISARGHLPHVVAPEQVTPLILEHLLG